MENQKIAMLFEGDINVSPAERTRLENELKKITGMLTFNVIKSEDGWMAKCNEVPGIIAGSSNSNPTDSEIKSQIRESIYSAFNVETEDNFYFSFQSVDGIDHSPVSVK